MSRRVDDPRRSGDAFGASLILVVLAFLLSQAVLFVAVKISGEEFTASATYARFDSGQYLDIANSGYTLAHCDPTKFGEAPYTRSDWCGNSAWFPGYPFAIDVGTALGLGPRTAGMLLSRIADLAVLAVLWFWFLRDRPRVPAVFTLMIAAVFPGLVYQDAVYPISLTLLSIMASLTLLARRRWLAAGAAGVVAVVSYPSGAALVAVGVLACGLMRGVGAWRDRARAAALYAAPLIAAYAAVLLMWQITVGRWDAWFLTEAHYGYSPTIFASTLWNRLLDVWPMIHQTNWPPIQSVVVAVVVLTALSAAAAHRRQLDAREVVLASYACVFWIVPLSLGGELSLHRAEALLLPVAALTWRLPRRLQIALVVVCAVVGVLIASSFIDATLS